MESIITLPFSCIKYYCLSFPSARKTPRSPSKTALLGFLPLRAKPHPIHEKRASPRPFHQTALSVPKNTFSRETWTHLWENPLFLTFSGPFPDHSSGKHRQDCQHKYSLYRHFNPSLSRLLKIIWSHLMRPAFPRLRRLRPFHSLLHISDPSRPEHLRPSGFISFMNLKRQLVRIRKHAYHLTYVDLLIN